MGKAIIIILAGFLIIFNLATDGIRKTGRTAEARLYSEYETAMVKNIANGGINIALYKISQNRDWNSGLNNTPLGWGTVTVSVTPRPDISEFTLQITSTAQFNGAVDSVITVLNAIELSNRFSRFAYFSDYEPTIYFYSADSLFGPVHTNGHFHMTGTPVFNGMVSSVSPTYATMNYTNPEFNGGTNFGRSAIDLPTNLDELRDAAITGGHVVTGNNLYLEFLDNGTYNYKIGSGSWFNNSLSSINGVIDCDRDIYVSGTVNGKVTVVSGDDIFITDDIVYSDDPLANPASDDILGLVALDDIKVKDNPQNRILCKIDACMFTIGGSFKAENIYFTPQGRLEILGGVVQDTRGAVGKLNPTSGFDKYYQYDERLEFEYPPFYPIAPDALSGLNKKVELEILYWVE